VLWQPGRWKQGLGGLPHEITESQLSAEYQRGSSKWPFIQPTELAHGLPKMLLYAVGSRRLYHRRPGSGLTMAPCFD
jgi:hypothetical protein